MTLIKHLCLTIIGIISLCICSRLHFELSVQVKSARRSLCLRICQVCCPSSVDMHSIYMGMMNNSFIILFILFVLTLELSELNRLTFVEAAFMFYAFGNIKIVIILSYNHC